MAATQRGKFQRFSNAGTGICYQCSKRTQQGILDSQCDLCDTCYTAAGIENEHKDGRHVAEDQGFKADCPLCQAG